METVTVSPKYQIVIPHSVRKSFNIKPGQKMQVIEYKGHIELIPVMSVEEARGFLKGKNIDTHIEREPDRL